jgi:hypothetical protein
VQCCPAFGTEGCIDVTDTSAWLAQLLNLQGHTKAKQA